MPEIASFGNIVNTLRTVRENYHQQLKSIPQYEAFLLIESSTEKAAGVLQGSTTSSASIATDVIDSLQFARNRFEQHMTGIPEYRVLAAIDKLIKDVSVDLGLEDQADESVSAHPEMADHDESLLDDAPLAEAETDADLSADEPDAVAEMETAEMDAVESAEVEDDEVAELDSALDAPPLAPAEPDAEPAMDDDIEVHVASESDAETHEDDDDLIVMEKAEA
jgi:hypothetical protein